MLAFCVLAVCTATIDFLGLKDDSSTVQGDVRFIIFQGVFLLLVAVSLSRSWRPALMFGLPPERPVLRRYALIVFPYISITFAALFLVYLPLSYISPWFVEWMLFDGPSSTIEFNGPLGNLLHFSCGVLIGPAFEEFVFRGLLFTRWSLKWNVPRAIFLSSALFAIGHGEPVHAFLHGCILCVLYIETKSLLVPIVIHMANNGIAWILQATNFLLPDIDGPATLDELQSCWWIGLLATAIAAPWVILFVRRHFPMADWKVPYLALQDSDQEPEILDGEYPHRFAH